MLTQLVALLAAALGPLAQAEEGSPRAVTEEAIARAVKQLGADVFEERQKATDLLWAAGSAAKPALARASESKDPEVRLRAKSILERFAYGIFIDTPPEVVALIDQFRDGDAEAKQGALQRLLDLGHARKSLLLVEAEPDPALRQKWRQWRDGATTRIVTQLAAAGDYDQARDLLELAATSDEGMRHLAVFLLLRGGIDERIAQLEAGDSPLESDDARLLVYLLRSKGDLEGARRAAESVVDPHSQLLKGVLLELRQWEALAGLQRDLIRHLPERAGKNIEQLGYAAAFHRLAGNRAEFEGAVRTIQDLAGQSVGLNWYCGEALLLCGRTDDAVALWQTQLPQAAFQVLCLQGRYLEAFKTAGMEDPGRLDEPWCRAIAQEAKGNSREAKNRFQLAASAARVLYTLGETEAALRYFSILAEAAKEDRYGYQLQWLCEAEFKAGLGDLALEHAAMLLEKASASNALSILFPNQSEIAEVWWTFLHKHSRQQAPRETLLQMRRLFRLPRPPDESPDDFEQLAEELQREALQLEEPARGQWLHALGETCLLHGRGELARRYLEKAAESSAKSAMRLGDFLARDGQWLEAARWYGKAWENDPEQSHPLYFQGRALVSAGQGEEGQELIEAALLAPLAASKSRYDLASAMNERGFSEEALEQWRLIMRSGPFQDQWVVEATKLVGNTLGEDSLQAADCWELMHLSCLQPRLWFPEYKGYVHIPHLIHATRARGMLAAGRTDDAIEEIRLSQSAWPANVELAEQLTPQLDRLGRREAADELFRGSYGALERICHGFPNSATHHNNLAWLAARCGRRLDDALQHAQRAVELAPNNPAYLDTLGEVHFARGQFEQALACARRCLELAPQNQHFRQQHRKFEEAMKR